MLGISACVSAALVESGGSPSLNAQALQLRQAEKSRLEYNDKQLQGCIVYLYLKQLELGIDPPLASNIEAACADFEMKYRASVMGLVREEWQNDETILTNTANTATENLYEKTLGLIE